ncbi:chemokine XC receptor 1-like [Dreissena polymorpha]|nr:chemokine XC receptor 1-like [Dreissena polymorpha]
MTSTALFLFALAISDTLTLFSGLLTGWVMFTWDLDIRLLSNPGCKTLVYMIYCSIHLSTWLIVAVTLERTACVLFPHKVRLDCSPRNAWLIIVTIVIAVFGINIILPVIFDLNGYEGKKCAPSIDIVWNVYQWIDFTLSFGAPFPLLLIGNVVIVVQLARSRSRNKRMNISGQAHDTRPLSMLIIALSAVFFLTMTPIAVMDVSYPYLMEKILALERVDPYTAWYDYEYLLFQQTVVELVCYFNSTFNFVFYVFSGTKFRTELKSMGCCQERKGTSLFITTTSK